MTDPLLLKPASKADRVVDPHTLRWARHVVAYIKPLGRPLSQGAPVEAIK